MSGLREQVAFAISHGNLTQNAEEETSADLIGALARADPLGAALWRVTGNMDVSSFREACELLYHRVGVHGQAPELRRRTCRQAIEEWLACLCPKCGGRSYVVSEAGVRSQCKDCKGTGRGRMSDDDRMVAMRVGKSTYSKLVAILDEAHALLNAADRVVAKQISEQLERKPLIGKIMR